MHLTVTYLEREKGKEEGKRGGKWREHTGSNPIRK